MKKKKEIWKDVPGYEGMYQASNLGRVRGVDRWLISKIKGKNVKSFRRGRILTPIANSDGYLRTKLSKDGKSNTIGIHRIVAITFVPNPENLPEINHKDCNRENNSVENLEWCTHTYNIQYTIKSGNHVSQTCDFRGEKNPNYNNKTLHEKYIQNPALAKEKQSRPGRQNGRSRVIYLFDNERNFIRKFDYILQCAEYIIEKLNLKIQATPLAGRIPKLVETNQCYRGKYYFSFTYDNTVPSSDSAIGEGVTTNENIA